MTYEEKTLKAYPQIMTLLYNCILQPQRLVVMIHIMSLRMASAALININKQ